MLLIGVFLTLLQITNLLTGLFSDNAAAASQEHIRGLKETKIILAGSLATAQAIQGLYIQLQKAKCPIIPADVS